MKFSEKKYLMIILKVTKKKAFHLFFRRYIFGKTIEGSGGQIVHPVVLGLKLTIFKGIILVSKLL